VLKSVSGKRKKENKNPSSYSLAHLNPVEERRRGRRIFSHMERSRKRQSAVIITRGSREKRKEREI